MNLDLLDAEAYDSVTQCLKLKGNTPGFSTSDLVSLMTDEDPLCWNSTSTLIFWDVQFVNSGRLDIAMNMAISETQAGNEIELDIGGEKLVIIVPFTGDPNHFDKFEVGSVCVKRTGRIAVKMQAKSIKDEETGACKFKWLELSGPAAVDAEEDMTPREISEVYLEASEVELCEYELCYTCITPSMSPYGSSFEIVRFNCGIVSLVSLAPEVTGMNLTVNLNPDHEVTGLDPEPDNEQEITQVKATEGVQEIFPEYCELKFPWNLNETYHFILKAERVEGENAVHHSVYVYLNDVKQWKFIVKHKVTNKTRLMTTMHHRIVAGFGFQTGYFVREACYGPTWCRLSNGKWKELTKFYFTQAGTLFNTDAGLKNNRLFLRTGGHTVRNCPLGSILTVQPTGSLPEILQNIDTQLLVATEVIAS